MNNEGTKKITTIQERTYSFSLRIIELTNELPQKRSAWVIADQLIRSATSIGANVVEARASSSRLEFKKFYEIALKSANETLYWLHLLKDSKLSTVPESIFKEITELSNILGKSVISLKQKKL